MQGKIDERLIKLDIQLPEPSIPIGNIVPYVVDGGTVYLSGQGTVWNGKPKWVGKVGSDLTVGDAQQATRTCVLNLIAQLKQACEGDLDRVTRILKVQAFVNIDPNFNEIAQAANGASDLFVEVFEGIGRHARTTAGVASLPRNSAAVVEAVVSIADQ